MKMSNQLVTAYMRMQQKIKDHRKIMNELREEERKIVADLRDYLNQTEEIGIRIDENTVITLTHNDKKINRTSKAYKAYLTELCNERGLSDDQFVTAILDGKIETTVQQQKIKIMKLK